MMRWFLGHYLRSPADGENPLLALLEEDDLQGLPSATVITAEIDPLRSEGMLYADRLEKARVRVSYANYPGVTHEFFGMGAVLPDAKKAVEQVAADLRAAFGHARTARR
jgi:acetyl esterase/lipase